MRNENLSDNAGVNLISEDAKCSCKGYNLDKLLQPNILIILARKRLHGYMIIQELENNNKNFYEKIDNAGVYRALKTLEDRGMISSEWEIGKTGPAKKTYIITDKGKKCLKLWIYTLEKYKKTIENIVAAAKNVLMMDNICE